MRVRGQRGFRIAKYKSHIFCAIQLQRVYFMSACSSHVLPTSIHRPKTSVVRHLWRVNENGSITPRAGTVRYTRTNHSRQNSSRSLTTRKKCFRRTFGWKPIVFAAVRGPVFFRIVCRYVSYQVESTESFSETCSYVPSALIGAERMHESDRRVSHKFFISGPLPVRSGMSCTEQHIRSFVVCKFNTDNSLDNNQSWIKNHIKAFSGIPTLGPCLF